MTSIRGAAFDDFRAPTMPSAAVGEVSLPERAFLWRLFVYAFLARASVAVLLDWTGLAMSFAPDAETYASTGREIALYWAGDILMKPWRLSSNQPLGYFYLNALQFYFFGNTEAPIKLVNALLGAICPRFVYHIARDLFGTAVARRAALLSAFFPSLILWSTLNIRDVWVVFLMLFISWKSLQVVRGYSHTALLSVIGGAFALTAFRDYLFYVVGLPPVAAFLIGRRGHLGRNFAIAALAGFGLLLLVQHGGAGTGATRHMSLEALSKTRQDLATGGSAFSENVDISTPGRALSFLPFGIAYFLFSPFPWQITSLLKAFALPEMLLVYYLTPSIVRGIKYAVTYRFRETLQILLLTALVTASYALGEGNVGTLYRHRAQAISFYLLFASVGVELKRQRQARIAAR